MHPTNRNYLFSMLCPGTGCPFTEAGGDAIRPDCDCIARGSNTLDSLDLYLLRGTEKAIADLNFDREHGVILEQDNEAMVFPIHNGKVLCFKFRKLYTKRWREVKANRVGRLLPPYLTRLQQRYSSYLQRPGLSRLPEELFPEPPADVETVIPAAAQGVEGLAPEAVEAVPAVIAEVPLEAVPAAQKVAEAASAAPSAPVTEAPTNSRHPGRNPASVVKGASLVTTSRNDKPSRTFNVSGTDKMDGSWVKSNILAWRVLD